MAEYAFAKMVEFLEYAGDKGLIKANTAQGYRVALSKLEDSFTDPERNDVRKVEPADLFQRFVNKNGATLSPGTLREYKRRLGTSIDEFLEWKKDPTAYKPKGRSSPRRKKAEVGSSAGDRGARNESGRPEVPQPPPSSGILDVPYPLRPDFVATVQIPRDMKKGEAERLAAFVRTLAVDFTPE